MDSSSGMYLTLGLGIAGGLGLLLSMRKPAALVDSNALRGQTAVVRNRRIYSTMLHSSYLHLKH